MRQASASVRGNLQIRDLEGEVTGSLGKWGSKVESFILKEDVELSSFRVCFSVPDLLLDLFDAI